MSVTVGDAHLGGGFRAIVNSKDHAITVNVVCDAASDVCLAAGNASLEYPKESVGAED